MMRPEIASWEAVVSHRFGELKASFPDFIDSNDPRLLAVRNTCSNWHGLRVLDLGCGRGRYGMHLESWGATTFGIDISASFMGSHATHSLKAVGSIMQLPFAESTFDVVLMAETLQHVHSPDVALQEATRVLNADGKLVIIDRNPWALNARRPWAPSLLLKWVDQHRGLWMYPPDSIVQERWYSTTKIKQMTQLNHTEWSWQLHYLRSSEEPCPRVHKLVPITQPFYYLAGTRRNIIPKYNQSELMAAS